jgi:tRNA pseudouridine55 synthase
MSARRARGRNIAGLLLLDKPRGLSSNAALQRVKRLYQAAKAGHTGSLDPLASGMLPVCFGAATRVGGYLLAARKTYRVVACLGVATDTGDAEGRVTERSAVEVGDAASVARAMSGFVGEIEQIPPMYSALKHEGVRLYRLARQGIEVPRAPRRIVIEALELESYAWPSLTFVARCSKGTYVRSLVSDLAAALGTCGHVLELRRLSVEPFEGRALHTLEGLEEKAARGGLAALDEALLPLDAALPAWPDVVLTSEAAERLAHGQSVAADRVWPVGRVRVYTPTGEFLAIGEVTADARVVPRRVFLP